jgi:hypothetical protein
VEALGGLWLNALRMTVVPLVFSLLVVVIASVADAAATGKLAIRAILLFSLLILAAAVYGLLAASGLLAVLAGGRRWRPQPHLGRADSGEGPGGGADARRKGFAAWRPPIRSPRRRKTPSSRWWCSASSWASPPRACPRT